MPRGNKSKLRAREKRHQTREHTSNVRGAQATAAEEGESPSTSPSRGPPQTAPDASIPQESQGVPPLTTVALGTSGTEIAGGAEGQREGGPSSSEASPFTGSSQEDPLTGQKGILLQFLLNKYKMKQLVTEAEMMMSICSEYRQHFPEILKRATNILELVFGLDLKEVDPSTKSFAIISKLDVTHEEGTNDGGGFPKCGILMPLLSMIMVKGDRATEEDVWEFLNHLGVYDGNSHLIYGEPRQLITQDLVQAQYLEYHQVPSSDPPRFEFRWGPRAHTGANKLKVMEYLAKSLINPQRFPTGAGTSFQR